MYATQERYNVRVPKLKHYYGLNHLHYSTTSIALGGIARPSVDAFDSERFRKQWVATFGELRRELKFRMNIWSPKKRDGILNPNSQIEGPWSVPAR
jgi:hypothetical protein